jgi:hypothetical protein
MRQFHKGVGLAHWFPDLPKLSAACFGHIGRSTTRIIEICDGHVFNYVVSKDESGHPCDGQRVFQGANGAHPPHW